MPQTSASVPPGYLVRIAVDTEMMRTKWGMKLTPGMSANVYLRGVSRTLLAYLIEPVTDSMSKAMREP
jgi:hypothetical protein